MGVDYDDLTNGEQNAPSIFSSAGLSAGAFLKSPYDSHPPGSNTSVPDIQVCLCRAKREMERVEERTNDPFILFFEAWFFRMASRVHGKRLLLWPLLCCCCNVLSTFALLCVVTRRVCE